MTTIPTPPPQHPRRRRYPMTIVTLARRMYGDGDSWTPKQIQRYLHDQHGLDVALGTIRYWVVPDLARKWRTQNREGYHRRKPVADLSTLDGRLRRMRELRDARLSYGAIAKILALDAGVVLTDEDVRNALVRSDGGLSPRLRTKLASSTRR